MDKQGKLKIQQEGDITLVSFLDVSLLDETSIQPLGKQLEEISSKENVKLILSFKNIEYASSAVLGRLVKIYKLVRANKGTIKLCNIKNNILSVFKVTKLDKMFEIHPDEDKALKSFKGTASGFKFFWQK
ncbi:MAG: STAS domain-containing protein [Candidatus Brocadiae bacterium]|nr:STAS domain-containing protein [Candidatus Brocadiia bacterium]